MKKLLILLLLVVFSSRAQSPRARRQQAAACVLAYLQSHQAARETWGTNRGPLVDLIVKAGGGNPYVRKPPEWCGFTQAAANLNCGRPIPRDGMQGAAAAWFPLAGPDAARTVFERAHGRGSVDSIAVGMKAGYDYGKGIHHINCVAALGRPVRAGRAPRSYWAYGGNEGTGTTAGVHYNLWPIGACDALSWW